jgi:hypothetical protein
MRAFCLCLLILSWPACSTTFPSAADSLSEGLARLGAVHGDTTNPDVVLVPDLHETHGSVTGGGPVWTRHRKWQMRALRFLASKGYRLLGAEYALGPLPLDGPAATQRRVYDEALSDGVDPDSLNLYIPLRVQWELPEVTVLGVEDPALYTADLNTLTEINKLRSLPTPEALEAVALMQQLVASLLEHRDRRGAAAARNLHALMKQHSLPRAVLVIGALHVPAASEALSQLGLSVCLFSSDALKPLQRALR